MTERPSTSSSRPPPGGHAGALWEPLFVGATRHRPGARRVALAFALAGVFMGLALAHPWFSICAWLAVACLAAALTWTESRLAALAGAIAVHLITRIVGLNWVKGMNEALLELSPLQHSALLVGQSLAWALPPGVTIGLAYIVCHKRVAVCWWLPIAWGAGEALRFELIAVNIGDWLYTQWTVEPILRAVGHLGWWPTHLACLFAAACLGQAVATRRRLVAVPGAVVAMGLLLIPPLPSNGTELLRGIVAVHTTSTVALPHAGPPRVGADDPVELIVWPEAAFHLRPLMSEGPGNGARAPTLLHDSRAAHLIGLETQLPGGRRQNSVALVDAGGRVLASRAKKLLFPTGERRFLGVGTDRFEPGARPALLNAAGRAVIPLICGEFLSRALVTEGRQAGGELMVVVARDEIMVNERAKRQLLAVQLLRSVEFGVPSVRASHGGWANFISSDGRVLAVSGDTRNGLLRWDPEHGARDVDFRGRTIDAGPPPIDPPAEVLVLHARDAPQYRTRCPEGLCEYIAVEDFTCPHDPVATVIVAGHGSPPTYLSQTPERIGAAIHCLSPELLVIDACFGASYELLAELAALEATVVAAPFLLPPAGLSYGPEFFASKDPERRASAIEGPPGGELLRWRINRDELRDANARVVAMDADALRASLVRRDPGYVGVELGGAGRVLVPFDWRRMQGGTRAKFKRVNRRTRPARRRRSRADVPGM